MIASNVIGLREERKCAQWFELTDQTAHRWFESFWVFPEENYYILYTRGFDSWKLITEFHPVPEQIIKQV
jgi:hypothetical protein